MKNDPAMKRRIDAWFDAHAEELLSDLRELVRIRSVAGSPGAGRPYGDGPAKALKKATELIESRGLPVSDFENRVITTELNGLPAELAILAHLDVVEEGAGWETDPFELTASADGQTLFGRGVSDDKGPAVAALYAMLAARELAPELTKGCRLILGSAEETGMDDLRRYSAAHSFPPYVFSPDADYPLINTEKGRFLPSFSAQWAEDKALPRIISVRGGTVPNIVPHLAFAEIEGLSLENTRLYCARFSDTTGVSITASEKDGVVSLTALGVAAHASHPENGNNAQTALISTLAAMPFNSSAGFKRLCALAELAPHGDSAGNALGLCMSDDISGELTLNFGVFCFSPTGMSGVFDLRTPMCSNGENTYGVFKAAFEGAGFTADISDSKPFHHTPPDSELVKTLLRVYEDYTGEKGKCLSVGGLTYVHNIEGGVAFGCTMPGDDSRIHGSNECMPLPCLITSAKMFTQAIIDLCS